MKTNHLKLIKLKHGEMIICHTNIRNYKDLYRTDAIEVRKPLAIVAYQVPTENGLGEGFILKPWIGVCVDESYVIPVDCVMTIGELNEEIKIQYENFLNPARPSVEVEELEDWEYETNFLKRNNLLN
jgi:hypothetical protein